jgi:hypothetical protein
MCARVMTMARGTIVIEPRNVKQKITSIAAKSDNSTK